MKVILYGNVLCECGCFMVHAKVQKQENSFLETVQCTNPKCSHFGQQFHAPTQELQAVDA